MKTAFRKNNVVTLRDSEPRPLQGDEIRIKVEACGICGTDIHQNPEEADSEQAFGHEMAGTVLAIGDCVTHLKVSDPVVIESATPCGRCDMCRNTRQELCTDIQSFFCTGTFGFAEEAIVPAISAIHCADLSPEISCLSEPLGVALDLVRLADITPESRVLILGQGPIGLMALARCRQLGAKQIFVSDFKKQVGRKRLAKAFGATDYIDPSEVALVDYNFNGPIDRILVTSPPPTLNSAFQVACKGAIISFIGIGHGDSAFCRFDVNDFHFKKLQLRASFASPALYTPIALDLLRSGTIDGQALISHTFSLNEMPQALEVAAKDPEAIKVIIKP